MTAVAERDAVMALLTAAGAHPLTASQRATAQAAGTLPQFYTEVSVTERISEYRRVGGLGCRGWRVQTRAVAKLEDNAENERAKTAAALEEKFFTVGGVESSAVTRGATDDPIAPDDGWFSGLSEWTYTR